jgi:glycine/D-amino acid oxidase-like deaminating enzyme
VTSLWLERAQPLPSDPLPEGPVDDLVVGAGITGLVTGLLLARSGRRVAVVEAREVGAVATGNTTAKISLLQGTKYSRLLHYQSQKVALAYVDANREGMEWLLRFCDDHGVDVQRRPAVTYAADDSELSTVRKEHDAASSLGLDVEWSDQLDVPFPHRGATVLADQAQFDPMDALLALVEQLREHGGTLHQGQRVRTVSLTGPPEIRLDDGSTIRASNVVLATGSPILDRGLYFSKLEPQRSYALAFEGVPAPEGMYLSAGSDTRSVRDAPHDSDNSGGTRLLVGGAGHSVGRTRSESEHVERLRRWTQQYFPGAIETHQWSAQDYRSHDAVPYVGRLPRGFGRIYVATGFDKWGMTNGVAAARSISGQILGQQPSWARTLGHRFTGPTAAAHLAAINIQVGIGAAGGAAEMLRRRGSSDLVPVCTHLGGPLRWNDCEMSWDCPLHGSRFDSDGEVLEGPATRPLKQKKR